MKMLKPKETNKKFYNKWLYKISLYLPGISILRIKSNNLLFNFLAPGGPEDKKNIQTALRLKLGITEMLSYN